MRKTGCIVLAILLAGVSGAALKVGAAERPPGGEPLFPINGVIRLVSGFFQVEDQPVTPQPVVPTAPGGLEGMMPSAASYFGTPSETRAKQEGRSPAGATSQGVDTGQATSQAPVSTAEVLAKSSTVQSVDVQRRSPIAMDPHVRGFKAGQIYTQADGAYWTPARQDLDTMLDKIDPGMIQDVVVIPGPYGLRYGPGFAFIDVVRTPTPRYDCGFEAHFDTTGNLRMNGSQLYGRETVYGGSKDWGFRFSYGGRKGADYEAGNDDKIPSSYENRDVWGEVSYDLNPHQRIDFAYQRLDQTDTEYPGQFFDLGFLGTYGFQMRIVDEDPAAPWTKLTAEGWYNRTRFHGDTSRKSNPNFPVITRVEEALNQQFAIENPGTTDWDNRLFATTRGGVTSGGARATATFGDPEDRHLNVGADVRYLGQVIGEHFDLEQTWIDTGGYPQSFSDPFDTNMPHAWSIDPGLFVEWSKPMTDEWTLAVGARVDFVQTKARGNDVRLDSSLPGGTDNLRQNDILGAFYLTNKLKLDENWTLNGGFGEAQRPPTMIERYADGMFLGIIQSGFTRVIGDPALNPERDWQVDLGLSADYESWRGSINAFHAWVHDYITLEDDTVFLPADFQWARLLRFTNTRLATLSGFEMAGEYHMLPHWSPYAKMSYVSGRDQAINAPLPAINPLEGTVGIRLHDAERGRRWGVELEARMVTQQDRLGTIRVADSAELAVIEEHTGGFAIWNLRAYWNRTEKLSLVAGIDNLYDKNYQEHLDLRLFGPSSPSVPFTSRVLAPGLTPYFGVRWVF